jgi:hypothetical protein
MLPMLVLKQEPLQVEAEAHEVSKNNNSQKRNIRIPTV